MSVNSLLCKWSLINQSVSINWLPNCWAILPPCLARLVSQIDWRLDFISADTSLRIDKSCVSYCAATLSIRRGHCKWAVTNGLITDWMRSKVGGDTEIAKWTAWMQHLHLGGQLLSLPLTLSHSVCLLAGPTDFVCLFFFGLFWLRPLCVAGNSNRAASAKWLWKPAENQ